MNVKGRLEPLTNIVSVEVFAKISEPCPGQDEEVEFGNELALFGASVETVPNDTPDFLSQSLPLGG